MTRFPKRTENLPEGGTKFLSTSSSTDSMNIILDLSWEIVIDDKIDIINVYKNKVTM